MSTYYHRCTKLPSNAKVKKWCNTWELVISFTVDDGYSQETEIDVEYCPFSGEKL